MHKEYSTQNATAVPFTNLDHFERFTTTVSSASIPPGTLALRLDSSYQTKTVFLRLITAGNNLSLYSFTDKLKTRFYILDVKNNILTELNYYVYLDEYNKATNVKKFQRQLYYFAAKYKTEDDGLQARINRAEYNQSDLIDVIGRINGTTG